MNRRDFFKYSTSTILIPTIVSATSTNKDTLNFSTNFLNNKKLYIDDYKNLVSSKPNIKVNEKKSLIKNDIFLDETDLQKLTQVRIKLKKIQNYVGHGNFNIISFDDMLKIAKRNSSIGELSKEEIEFFERFFYYDPSSHGFYGEMVSKNITDKINKNNVKKIPHTGHYLFKGHPEEVYKKMLEDIGPSLVLTSGVRSIVKQSKLFFDKLASTKGNLNLASKSLAPPAYTYHSVCDFDVGKKGLGYANFSARFALTKEFKEMRKLNYIDMRYTVNNKDGVRYEPWHVKII